MSRFMLLLADALIMLLLLMVIPIMVGVLAVEVAVHGWRKTSMAVKLVVGVSIVAVIALAACSGTVMAQHAGHNHPPQHASLHDTFYSTWMRPDNRAISCCNKQDCAPAQAERRNGIWWARRDADGKWLPVPRDRVETERDSPDGQNHLCVQPPGLNDAVFCFIAGAGG